MEDNSTQLLKKPPRQKRSKALVAAILESATRVLKKAGYKNTTTNWVAEVAGISVGSLYQYFPNKEAIVHFLIQKAIRECIERGEKKLMAIQTSSLDEAVDVFVRHVVDMFTEYREELRAIFRTALFIEHIEYLHKAQAGFSELLERRLKEFDGEIQMHDPALTAFVLHHSIMGVIETYVADETVQIPKEDLVRELNRLVLGYLRPVARPV